MKYALSLIAVLTLSGCFSSQPVVKKVYVHTKIPVLPLYKKINKINFGYKNCRGKICINNDDFNKLINYTRELKKQNLKYRNVIILSNKMAKNVNKKN